MTFKCNPGAAVTALPSHSPDASPTMSFGATASSTSSYAPTATGSPTPSPLHALPPAPPGFHEDLSYTPTVLVNGAQELIAGFTMPAGRAALDIFCGKKCGDGSGVLPAGVSLHMSVLVHAPNALSLTHITQLGWKKDSAGNGAVFNLAAADAASAVARDEWVSLINAPCSAPNNPSGHCAVKISNDDASNGYRVWFKVYSNAGPPAPAAAPTVSSTPLIAGAAGGAVFIILICLLLHWLRVLTVPCFNCLCDHRRAGLAKPDRRSFGEVVTQNDAYNVQSFETVLPQRKAGV
jgi:hypothetical protein